MYHRYTSVLYAFVVLAILSLSYVIVQSRVCVQTLQLTLTPSEDGGRVGDRKHDLLAKFNVGT
jgi:hypothetical protein